MARKTDRVADGCGIDGAKGQNFTKKFASSPWSPPVVGDGYTDIGKKSGHTRDTDAGLRNKLPDEATAKPRDIFDNVEKNQLDDCTGPVKFGVD